MAKMAMMSKWVFLALVVFGLFSWGGSIGEADPSASQISSNSTEADGLEDDFYKDSCPALEDTVWVTMAQIFLKHRNAPAQLLRLLFHDCFIEGCDASVLLEDSHGGSNNTNEKDAIPNRTLRGSDYLNKIKEELEKVCPGVVSCADTLVLATRDAVVMLPRPDGNISETLRLFGMRGFTARETVALLGAHNIGKIDCQFIQPRLGKFMGMRQPDSTIAADFVDTLRSGCQADNKSAIYGGELTAAVKNERVLSSMSSGSGLDSHYYQNLLRGRGLLFADQQLMANEKTAAIVREYASNATVFRRDFAAAMMKLSSLGSAYGITGPSPTQLFFKSSHSSAPSLFCLIAEPGKLSMK